MCYLSGRLARTVIGGISWGVGGGGARCRQGPVPDSLSVCITDWALIKSEAPIPALPPILHKEESEKKWRS